MIIAEIGKNQFSQLWSNRKLLICFTLWNSPNRTTYSIRDFIFPVRYPRSIRTDSWEVVRVFQCLHNLEEVGVRVKQKSIDPLYYAFSGKKTGDGESQRKIRRLSKKQIKEELDRIKGDHFNLDVFLGIGKKLKRIRLRDRNKLVLPRFLHFTLEIDRKKLGEGLRTYIRSYSKGKVKLKQSRFGKKFNQQVLNKFLKAMEYRQGQEFHFALGSIEDEDYLITDEFTEVFKRSFPCEAKLWQKGIYEFPFFHHLIALHFKRKLTFSRIKIRHDDLENLLEDNTALDWLGFDEVPLISSLQISISPQKQEKGSQSDFISHIEVIQSEHDEFVVYVNDKTDRPILLSKKQSSGRLLYEVATKGFASYDRYRKAFDYIRKDRRFKLFTQTKATFKPLLELDQDGYIVPTADVTIEVRKEGL